MVDLIHLQQNWLDNIMPNELKPRIPKQMHHILLPTGKEIIDDDHIITSGDKLIHQMTPNETGASGDNNPLPLAPNPNRHSPHTIGELIIITSSGVIGIITRGIGAIAVSDDGITFPSCNPGGARIGRGEDGEGGLEDEEGGADENPDEDEEEALLLEDVVERSGERSRVLEGFGGVGRGLGEGHFLVFAGAGGLLVQLLHCWRNWGNCRDWGCVYGVRLRLLKWRRRN